MNTFRITLFLLAGFLGLAANRAAAQWVQQQVVLKPGWNAVFLEIDPAPNDCDTAFAGLPVESVWDWNRTTDTAQFVQDPSTLLPGATGWLTWFPPNHALASQGSLFALRDGRPYLIKSTNAQPVTWTISGRPSLRRLTWRPGTVNLVGFHVGAPAPTFQMLFAGQTGLAGQPVYTLDATGVWRALGDLSTARPRAGEAYWVRCRQPSQTTGTTVVEGVARDGLAFTATTAEQSIRIRNASTGPRSISIRILPSTSPPAAETPLAGPVPLEYWRAQYAATNFSWAPFPGTLSFPGLASGQEWNIRLGVPGTALAGLAGWRLQSVMEVSDDLGMRWLVPIKAGQPQPASSVAGFQVASGPGDSALAGLWVGDAVVNAVSQPAHLTSPSAPQPAGGTFSFRILMHVDQSGAARLLQQVFLVRKPPVLMPDENDPFVDRVLQPARTVAVTDEALIPGIIGTAQLTGRRISSPAFAFEQPVALTGGSFGAGALQGSIVLDYDHPLNPFKHVFHPDHNNLDERFEQKLPEGKEAFTVSRSVSFEFTANDPLGLNPPGWGATEVGGIYRESIAGLHRAVLQASGSFRLVRVLSASTLNE